MSLADEIYRNLCIDILENGWSDENGDIRPRWKDGTPAYTLKRFGVVNRYDLSKEFPIITMRRIYFKSAIDELLWIYQKKSNRVADLNSRIWDSWADEQGTIGKAYGYQVAQKHLYKEGWYDQIDRVIYDLQHNPYSRSIKLNMYNHADLYAMRLRPCAHGFELNVAYDRLNMILFQRSQDVLVAGNWNVVQYAVLLHMLAHISNFPVGELVHVITDAHIYDRHIPIVRTMLELPTYDPPLFKMNTDIKDFYDFTVDDFSLEGYMYNSSPIFKDIPVAI
jgi:thymidylate synthase